MTTQTPHFVYEAFDASGEALYVGCTANFGARMQAHFRTSPWSHMAATFTVTRYANRGVALDAEKAAIRSRRPRFNLTSNPDVPVAAPAARTKAKRDRMRWEHEVDPDCPYHWRQGCQICNDELNAWIGTPAPAVAV